MRALVKRFPTRAKLVALPRKTLEGRTVYGLEVCTDVDRRDGRPVLHQDGCQHAREWPAAEVPLMWAYQRHGRRSGRRGAAEALLTVTGPSGVGVSRCLVVKRSQRIDLGTLVVE